MRDLSPLRKARDHREFLSAYLALKGLSVAQFARRAGFASRGYPAEILKGRRRLSPKAMPGILRALQLPAAWKHYFQYLVAVEVPEVLPNSLTPEQMRERLEKMRQGLRSQPIRREVVQPKNQANRIFEIRGFLRVYAALGDAETGATLKEIMSRACLSRSAIEAALKRMTELDLITTEGEPAIYRPAATHLASLGMGDSDFFRQCFLETLREVRERAQRGFHSPDELFLASSFTVRAADLPEIKRELRETITRYVDEHMEPRGDVTVDLALGMVRPLNWPLYTLSQ